MNCLFGHKFGKIEADGYQYCIKCGLARKPSTQNPCENGHSWEEIAELKYEGYYMGTSWTDYKVAYKCKNCGEVKSQWRYGH